MPLGVAVNVTQMKHEILLVINIHFFRFACPFVTDITHELQILHGVRGNMTDYVTEKLKR
jgi:hypothetical protein